jgi:hypothetical protein
MPYKDREFAYKRQNAVYQHKVHGTPVPVELSSVARPKKQASLRRLAMRRYRRSPKGIATALARYQTRKADKSLPSYSPAARLATRRSKLSARFPGFTEAQYDDLAIATQQVDQILGPRLAQRVANIQSRYERPVKSAEEKRAIARTWRQKNRTRLNAYKRAQYQHKGE